MSFDVTRSALKRRLPAAACLFAVALLLACGDRGLGEDSPPDGPLENVSWVAEAETSPPMLAPPRTPPADLPPLSLWPPAWVAFDAAVPAWVPEVSGWVEQGYTASSSGSGRLAVAPEMNRFGDEYTLDQLAVTLQRRCDAEQLSWGYYLQMFSGADASTLQGPGDIRNTNSRFGGVVRQARVQTHLPWLTSGGVDVVLGRQGSPMGFESYMAPLRPFYSLSYQWFYAEDGADTGCWTTGHLDRRWDVMYGVTLGSNTFFTLRAHHPCQVAQVKRWLDDEHRAYWCATLIAGDQAVGKNFIAYPGTFQTVLELRAQVDAGPRWTHAAQANVGWDDQTLVASVGRWAGLLGASTYHWTRVWDVQGRLEWFDDENGVRTGVATSYYAVTGGLVAHCWGSRLLVRPELRGDFAGQRVFGPLDSLDRKREQLTAAVDCVLNF